MYDVIFKIQDEMCWMRKMQRESKAKLAKYMEEIQAFKPVLTTVREYSLPSAITIAACEYKGEKYFQYALPEGYDHEADFTAFLTHLSCWLFSPSNALNTYVTDDGKRYFGRCNIMSIDA
jgi:hypothetical protein